MPPLPKLPRGYSPIDTCGELPLFLYHATAPNNLESIKRLGIIKAFRKGLDPEKDQHFIWFDAQLKGLRKFLKVYYQDKSKVILQIRTEHLDPQKLYRKMFGDGIIWYCYSGDVPSEAIKELAPH